VTGSPQERPVLRGSPRSIGTGHQCSVTSARTESGGDSDQPISGTTRPDRTRPRQRDAATDGASARGVAVGRPRPLEQGDRPAPPSVDPNHQETGHGHHENARCVKPGQRRHRRLPARPDRVAEHGSCRGGQRWPHWPVHPDRSFVDSLTRLPETERRGRCRTECRPIVDSRRSHRS
jgi:hypothetical protein